MLANWPTEPQELRVLDLGAEFVGIASRSRFEHAPGFSDPKKLLPDFRSVVALGVAMNRGSLEAWFSKLDKCRIPEEEIRGLTEGIEGDGEATGYAASEGAAG